MTTTTTWVHADGHEMSNRTNPPITGPEFAARYPDGRAWRRAGRPDYGFRAWQDATAARAGLVVGEDYQPGLWSEYEYVLAWAYGTMAFEG